jgi:hypothetical protein
MAAISAYLEAVLLNYSLRGTTATPAAWAVGLSLGVPSSTSGSEMTTASGYARITASFGAAASPGGSATNATPMTFGPFSGAASITGIQIWDSVLSLNSGNMLYYGTLTTPRTVGVGDSLVIASAALTVSLA